MDGGYCFGPGLGLGAGACDGDPGFEGDVGNFCDGCHFGEIPRLLDLGGSGRWEFGGVEGGLLFCGKSKKIYLTVEGRWGWRGRYWLGVTATLGHHDVRFYNDDVHSV